ncbi:MAG: hypothetical protein WAQ53_16135 [Thiofilum sp.]|uniref:hypothetical protein n=1 Tax=Thiofilum sp. TaxID=2212733 RepID=UPI0025DD40EF|nr:hypothetical protein [Thiofilum sp.]MBK8452378.1 hypothetical protein [Thiofilum sp.]
MKFIVKREPAKDIEVISFEIEQPSMWTHWKALSVAFIAGVLITIMGLAWVYKSDLYKNGVEFQMNRSMTFNLGKVHEQERNRSSPNGATTTSD